MKKILDRLTALVMVMLMVIQTITPAITSFAKEEELDKRYVIQKLETLKQDSYANFSLNLATVIDDKNLDTDTNVKFVLNATDINSNIKLLVRKDFSLYDERTFDTVEEAHKELDRVDKSLKDQGLSLDVSVVQEDGKYRIHNNYTPTDDEQDYGQDYKVYSLDVIQGFDFEKEGLFNKLPENLKSSEQHELQLAEERRLQEEGEVPEGDKHNRTYIFDFKVDKAVDSKLTTVALNKDENNPLEVKQNADLFAAILDDKTYSTYQTEQLPAEVTSSIEHKKEVAEAKAKADAKAKAEADAKAKKEADEKAKKEAEEKAKADAKAKEEADAKAKQEADAKAKEEAEKIKTEEANKTEEQKALEEKAKADADAKAKAEADAKAKAEAEKLKAEAEAKAKQEELAKKQAEAEAKKAAEEKAKKDLENKKLLGLVQDTEEEQEEPIIKKKETKEEVKREPATPEERKQKAEEFDKALQDKKEDIKKSEDKKDANNKEDNKKTTDKKEVSEETKGLLEGIKEFFGFTNLQKADRELKAILSVKANGLKEVQALLSSFETKYHLTKEEQAKLMDDNKDAIKALIEEDADKNFNPQVFAETVANTLNLDGKKFNIGTRFDTSTVVGPIKKGQYFNIHLDDQLTVKEGTKLEPIKHNGKDIASPTYDRKTNTIKYEILNDINQDIQVPLDIPVDYNTDNITLDDNGNFIVINSVSGLGVTEEKDLLPQEIDRNGNPAGSIIEPGRKDVTQIIEPDDSSYKINTDAYANPVVKNGEIQGYNWTIKVTSDTDLDKLGYKINFTTVKGSGLGEITSRDTSVKLADQLEGALGIHDSKHHAPGAVREITYNLYTPVKGNQENYMMDISVILTEKKDTKGNPKVGAERIVTDGWDKDKVKESTPIRAGINNRTTILGKFTSENSAKWTVTDGVSTGDDKGTKENPADTKLPWETRSLSTNQKLKQDGGQIAVYKIGSDGKMVQDGATEVVSEIPGKGTNSSTDQPVGTIAVYEYDTSFEKTEKDPLRLSGVAISKYEDIEIEQTWSKDKDLKMPGQKIQAVDPNNKENVLGEVDVAASTDPNEVTRKITIPNAKVWKIENGKPIKTRPIIKQDLPKTDTIDGDTISYYETSNFYRSDSHIYSIYNSATKDEVPKFGNFTIIKTDSKDPKKKLAGATFKILNGPEVTTDENGRATFNSVKPGTYELFENKAPKGYRLNKEKTVIKVDENGRVSLVGGDAELSVGSNPTKTVEHRGYPDYMNAMQYATKDADGKVTTYVFLKANAAKKNGSTNKNTRLNIRMNNGSISNIGLYDVEPVYGRPEAKTAMTQQTMDELNLGTSVINVKSGNNEVIAGTADVTDSFTKNKGYEIKIPSSRLRNDWGFMLKVEGTGDSLTYDWLTDNENVGTEARLQNQTITPGSETDTKETTITLTNEAFETRPVEITKMDKDKKGIAGASFIIKDSTGKVLATVDSAEEGKATFGDYPEGTYTIEEFEAPEGYIKSDVVFDVTVDDSSRVTYKPRFKTKSGTPVNGLDYWLEDKEESDDATRAVVDTITQELVVDDTGQGDRPGVWEAYRLESLKYNAKINLKNSAPGTRFSIQFDPNLDFTQYFSEFPKIMKDGKAIADPYFNYDTNKLVYVFNKNSDGGIAVANIKLDGIIPSKFYAKNDGTFPFKITVAPGQKDLTGNTLNTSVQAWYDAYDTDVNGRTRPNQNYYFRDVYQDDKGDWYVKAFAYYNPLPFNNVPKNELKFSWMSTNWQPNTHFAKWQGNGTTPAFTLRDVKVYRTQTDRVEIDKNYNKSVEKAMPLSMGIRPEDDPATYNLVYSSSINPNGYVTDDRQGDIKLNYNPYAVQSTGELGSSVPLRIEMPAIPKRDGYGYVIEQTFKVDDIDKFRTTWRAFEMTNGDPNARSYVTSAFVSRANKNFATGDQTGGEIPKFFSQEVGLMNKEYTPGSFKIRKIDDTDRKKNLSGATFSLRDGKNNKIYRSSGDNGIVEFKNLKPGSYRLVEETAPDKYVKSNKRWRVNVSNEGYVTIRETGLGSTGETLRGKDTIELPVTNKPAVTEFKVYKKDDKNNPLGGAKFTLTKKGESTAIAEATSDINGVVDFKKKLDEGTYILEETEAPKGYKKLNKKWVVEVDTNGKAKIYNYIDTTGTSNPDKVVENSLLGEKGVKWVNVSRRPTENFVDGDNRTTGYTNKHREPYKLGTRIVGINKEENYAIQRYVINPEASTLNLKTAQIHREKPHFNNMDWYAGNDNEEVKIFRLDKAVNGNVEDIRLENYNPTEITKDIDKKPGVITGQNRLVLDFKNQDYTNPIVIDVKIPYKNANAGVGTGMDLYTGEGNYWKSDYYDSVNQIVEGPSVLSDDSTGDSSNKGSYVSEDFLEVSNQKKKYEFSFNKVDEGTGKPVSGAQFKLIGPKVDDENPGNETYMKSGADGLVHFKDLVPGIYKLVETEAAQGYEKSNTDWTVSVTKDGKIYIRDNNPGTDGPATPVSNWQKVTAGTNGIKNGSSQVPGTPVANRLDTRITEVNPKENKFRQVYIINKQPEQLLNSFFEIHSQKENRNLNLDNTQIVSLVKVGRDSTPDNLVSPGESVEFDKEVITKNGYERIKITPKGIPDRESQALALTIESTIGNSGNIGTGIDFVNFDNYNTYWMAEYYNSFNDIKLDPVETKPTDKNRTVYVGTERATNLQTPPRRTDLNNISMYSSDTIASRIEDRNIVNDAMVLSLASLNRSVEAEGLEIGDDLVGTAQKAGDGWEKVQLDKSRGQYYTKTGDGTWVNTWISEVNKDQGKFRQIFEIKDGATSPVFYFRTEPYEGTIVGGTNPTANSFDFKVNSVTVGGQNVSPSEAKFFGYNNGGKSLTGYQFKLNGYQDGKIRIEVEYSYPKTGEAGMGVEFRPIPTRSPIYASQRFVDSKYVNIDVKKEFDINFDRMTNGSVSADKTNPIPQGQSVTLTAEPNDGYELDKLYVDGKDVTSQVTNNTYTFKMPEKDVPVSATFKQKTYEVKYGQSQNGTISADKTTGIKKRDRVYLTYNPTNANYEFDKVVITADNGDQVFLNPQNKSFLMPGSDVTVSVIYKTKTYFVGTETETGGQVTISPTKAGNRNAEADETVKFTIKAYDGYKLTGAEVKQGNGTVVEGVSFDPTTGEGSFTMPASAVTVHGQYEKLPEGTRYESLEREETLPFETITEIDERLNPGEKVVDQKGQNGSAKYKYKITIDKTAGEDAAYPADWPEDLRAEFQARKKAGERIAAYSREELSKTDPTPAKVRKGKTIDPIDDFKPTAEDIIINPDGEKPKDVKITNKKTGITPKVVKRDSFGNPLAGAKFTVKKMTDDTYKTEDTTFTKLSGTSDEKGNVEFKNQAGNVVKLEEGYYILTEDKAPTGYKKIAADWKIEVKDQDGRMYSEYLGPEETPSSLINDDKKANAGDKTDKGIKTKSRLTFINPEANTFVQRIYVDTREYKGTEPLNVQITPKYKREEKDIPGEAPVTIKDGVKTAYRTTYKIENPESNADITNKKFDDILRTYDLSDNNVSMVNTARWRPFDWGFDEDQLNLDKGVYIIEIEGYYDDAIITGNSDKGDKYTLTEKELGKLDLHVDFYEGARKFEQLKLDANGNETYEAFEGASYQGGMQEVAKMIESKENAQAAKTWNKETTTGNKYANFISKEASYNGEKYTAGKIEPALPNTPEFHADTRVDLDPLYKSDKPKEIPQNGLEVENDKETYNITFSKHGRDNPNLDLNSKEVTENRLEGAVFKLQQQAPGGGYEDIPGTTVSSAFNGYFGFRNLTPGRYRLMEVKAPKGYRPIKDPILYMTIGYTEEEIVITDPKTKKDRIIPKGGYITLEYNKNAKDIIQYAPDTKDEDGNLITPEDGKLVDYVTSATAKNMGKIINEKPGKGEITITKKDGDGALIDGAKFELVKLSSEKKDTTNPDNTTENKGYVVESGTIGSQTDEDGNKISGKLVFKDLPIGKYELRETKPAPGHQNTGQIWRFVVGGKDLDPYSGPITRKGSDITDKISIEKSDMKIVKPNSEDGTTGENTVYPNSGHMLSFDNEFKIADGTTIRPGDSFKVRISDYMDLKGIYPKESISYLDIFAEGIGTIAKADYDETEGTITYTFTDYVDTYELTGLRTNIASHVDPNKLKKSASKVPVGLKMDGSNEDYKTVDVIYDLGTVSRQDGENTLNLSSKITHFDPSTGEFEHIIYVNRDQENSNEASLSYYPGTNIENVRVVEYKIQEKWTQSAYRKNNLDILMPPSYAVSPDTTNMRITASQYVPSIGSNGRPISIYDSQDLKWNDSYIVKITGKVSGKDKSYYNPKIELKSRNANTSAQREDYVYGQLNSNSAEGKLEVTAINPKNEINFRKTDQKGEILKGAKFALEKYDESSKKWTQVEKSEKEVDDKGIVSYEKLSPGKYALIEKEAPKGYNKIEGHVQEFTVGEDGVITRKVEVPKDSGAVNPNPVGDGNDTLKPASQTNPTDNPPAEETSVETVEVDQVVGTTPINVVNYKEIEFEKVDAEDNNTKLEGAEFEVHKKDDKGKYQPLKVKTTDKDGKQVEKTVTVKSDENGKFTLPITKDGYYALKETKAPDGYSKMPGMIKEFKIEDGKIKILKKAENIGEENSWIEYNDDTKPIKVENNKSIFPHTGAMGIFGFLIVGTIVMATSYYKYRKKKRGRALS